MKKLLCMAAAALMLTACGGSKETKTVTCTQNQNGAGYKTETKIDFKYAGEVVKKQLQTTTISFTDEDIYSQMKPIIESGSKESVTKGMDGVEYALEFDENNKVIKEKFNIDITEISSKNYASLTGMKESDLKGMNISMEKTRDSMVKGGMKCSAME